MKHTFAGEFLVPAEPADYQRNLVMYRLLLFQKWFLIFARNYSGTGIQAFWRRIRSLGLAMFILVAIQVGTTPAVASTLDQRKLLSAEPAAFPCGSGEFTQYGMNATGLHKNKKISSYRQFRRMQTR